MDYSLWLDSTQSSNANIPIGALVGMAVVVGYFKSRFFFIFVSFFFILSYSQFCLAEGSYFEKPWSSQLWEDMTHNKEVPIGSFPCQLKKPFSIIQYSLNSFSNRILVLSHWTYINICKEKNNFYYFSWWVLVCKRLSHVLFSSRCRVLSELWWSSLTTTSYLL